MAFVVHIKLVMMRLSILIFIGLHFIFTACFAQAEQELIEALIRKEAQLVHLNSESLDSLKSLSHEEKEIFYFKRNNTLRSLAVALNMIKYGFGAGSIVKQKIVFWKKLENSNKKSIQEVSNDVLFKLLGAIDNQLHQQAKVFINKNEIGFLMSVHFIKESYVINSSGKGGCTGFGLSVGVNSNQKMLIFQIYKESENFKSSIMPAFFVVGAVFKGGGYMANNKNNNMISNGEAFYPPAFPGFKFGSTERFALGGSSGFTIPPAPIGDLLTYTNTSSQESLLQIRISPFYNGFIRINSILGVRTADYLKMSLNRVHELMLKVKTQAVGNKCEMLFN